MLSVGETYVGLLFTRVYLSALMFTAILNECLTAIWPSSWPIMLWLPYLEPWCYWSRFQEVLAVQRRALPERGCAAAGLE